jgi:hypothetical protein
MKELEMPFSKKTTTPEFHEFVQFNPIIPRYSIPNEYIALELTKAWAGQSGNPACSDRVIGVYKKFLKELNKKEDK